MYNVSENYINAVRAKTRSDRLLCTLTFPDDIAHPVSLTDADYGEGSISIEWQSVDGDELMFGSAIAASLSISLRTSVNRYRFYGAKLEPIYQVKTGTNTWESVPLGVFTVTDAERVGSIVNITAVDNMQALDLAYGSAVLQGTAYEVLQAICEDTGLTLGMSGSDMTGWPNTETIIQIDVTNGCSTYRDALKGVCQLVGAFAIIDRAGQLVLKQFHTTKDLTLGRTDRYSSTIADYTCNYVGLSVTGMGGTYTKESQSEESGLIMFIKDAIGWDPVGEDNLLKYRTNSLFTYLETIEYTPSDFEMPGDPSLECGDMIELVLDADGEETVNTILTSVDWSYRKPMSLESVGQNPFLSGAVGSIDKSNRVLSLQGEQNKVVMYTYRNSSDIVVESTDTNICKITFATMGATDTLFYATVLLEAIPDAPETRFISNNGSLVPASAGKIEANFTYVLNNETVNYHPTEVMIGGKHAFVLFFPIQNLAANNVYSWQVLLNVSGGQIKILEDDLRVVLWGQNLVAAGVPWDGLLEIMESIAPVQLGNTSIDVRRIIDVPAVTTNSNAASGTYTESIPVVAISSPTIALRTVADAVVIGRQMFSFVMNTDRAPLYTYNHKYLGIYNDAFVMNTGYMSLGSEEDIDVGKLLSASVELGDSDFESLDDLDVVATGGGESSGLPEGYQEVEYIASSGTQYIDTELTGTNFYQIDIQFTSVNTRQLFGTGDRNLEFCGVASNGNWEELNYPVGASPIDRHTLNFDVGTIEAQKFGKWIDDATPRKDTSINWSSSISNHIKIFDLSATPSGYYNWHAKVYEFKAYTSYQSGIVIADMIPCYRKSDNVIGMYDVARNRFFTNAGTGVFTKGRNIVDNTTRSLVTDDTNVYTLSDGEIESVTVQTNYMQDLHGYDKPWIGGNGKNIIPYPYSSQSGTYGGISFDVGADGKITANGTTSDSFSFYVISSKLYEAGTYTVSFSGSFSNVTLYVRDMDNAVSLCALYGEGNKTFTIDTQRNIRIYFRQGSAGQTVSVNGYIMLEKQDNLLNVNPSFLSGHVAHGYYQNFNVNSGVINEIRLEAGKTYRLTANVTASVEPFRISVGGGERTYAYDIATIDNLTSGLHTITFTPTARQLESGNILAFRIPRYSASTDFDYSISFISLEEVTEPSAYEPYANVCPITGVDSVKVTVTDGTQTEEYTADLGQTVYEGDVEMVAGIARSTRTMMTFNGSENWTADTDVTYFRLSSLLNLASSVVSNMYEGTNIANVTDSRKVTVYASPFSFSEKYVQVGNIKQDGTKMFASVEDFKAYLGQHTLQVSYKSSITNTWNVTPQDIQLIPNFTSTFEAGGKNMNIVLSNGNSYTGTEIVIPYMQLVNVGDVADLSANMFEEYGFYDTEVFSRFKNLFFALGDFSIKRWYSNEEEPASLTVTLYATPNTQAIVSNAVEIAQFGITSVQAIEFAYSGTIHMAISVDNGAFMKYDTVSGEWIEGDMSILDATTITEEQWSEIIEGANTMKIKILVYKNSSFASAEFEFLTE